MSKCPCNVRVQLLFYFINTNKNTKPFHLKIFFAGKGVIYYVAVTGQI